MNKQTRNIVFIFMFIVLGIMCAGYIMGFAPVYADKMTFCGEGLDIGDRMATDDHVWVTEYGHYICDICGVDGGFVTANDIVPAEPEKPVETPIIPLYTEIHKYSYGYSWSTNGHDVNTYYWTGYHDNISDEDVWINKEYVSTEFNLPHVDNDNDKYCDLCTHSCCHHKWFVSEVRNDDFIHTIRYTCSKCGEIDVYKDEHYMNESWTDRNGCTITEYHRCGTCGYTTSYTYESHIGPFHRYTGDIVRCEECYALYNYITGESYDEPA